MGHDILTLLTALLGGVNLIQFAYVRQLRRKEKANADMGETMVEKERMSMHHDGTHQMIEEIDTMKTKLVEMNNKSIEYLEKISDLKTKIIYLSANTCFREGCSKRIKKEKRNEEDNELYKTTGRC